MGAHAGVTETTLVPVHVVDTDPGDEIDLGTEPTQPGGGVPRRADRPVPDHRCRIVGTGDRRRGLHEDAVEDVADDEEALPGSPTPTGDRPSGTGCGGR
ncbi:hypothetical protein P9139_18895 [Curtobacterium flaccumfaciens]|nr:hypothetical protein P9139_18895 [Curtobacterium flaccumfaciens]